MLGTDGNDSKPSIEERYEVATNTSDLTLSLHRSGAADVLLAAGMTQKMLGGAMHRLHTQWIAVKPRQLTDEVITEHAATLPQHKGRPDVKRARREVMDAYLEAVSRLAANLRGRQPIVAHLKEWAAERGVDPGVVERAVTHWLAPQCPICDGHGKRKLPGAPVLGISCWNCHETGRLTPPSGAGLLFDYINDAIEGHRQSMKRRLRQA